MKIHPKLICCFLPLLFLSGCKKGSSTPETSRIKSPADTNAGPRNNDARCKRSYCCTPRRPGSKNSVSERIEQF
jgi:hypothetical protein